MKGLCQKKKLGKAFRKTKAIIMTLGNALETLDGQQLVEADSLEETIQILFSGLAPAVLMAAKAEITREFKDDRPERKPIPEAIRKQVMERDRHRCVYCHAQNPLHIHHYVPVSKRGGNTVGNLVLLCPNCHTLVHAKKIKIKKPSSFIQRVN